MSLPRMRTADKALAILKEDDPDTGVTLHYIRYLIKSGKVPSTPVGRKKLVNTDALIAYIAAGGDQEATECAQETGQIRRVHV